MAFFSTLSHAATAENLYQPMHLAASDSFDPKTRKIETELIDTSKVLEEKLFSQGAVYDDPELENYLNRLIPVEALGDEAKGFYFRVKVLKSPKPNAFITASGTIFVESGLFSIVDSSDQMRMVLAHEAKHAIDRDIVHWYKNFKGQNTFKQLFDIALVPAAAIAIHQSDSDTASLIANIASGASLLVSVSYVASVTGYGRANEIECDEFGMHVIHRSGHSIQQAREFFKNFEAEQKRYMGDIQTHLFSTHEAPKDRLKRIGEFEKKIGAQDVTITVPPDDPYMRYGYKVIKDNAALNIRLGRVQHAMDDLEKLLKANPADADIQYLMGEAHRALADEPDMLKDELKPSEWNTIRKVKPEQRRADAYAKAIEHYGKAVAMSPQLAAPHKGLGLLYERAGKNEESIKEFEQCFLLDPTSKDKNYVTAKVQHIKERIAEAAAKAALQAEEKKEKEHALKK